MSRWTNNVWLVTSSNKFLYDGWNLVAELNATNNALLRSYAWGLDLSGQTGSAADNAGGVGGLLWINDSSTLNSQPSTHLVSYDGNGNVTALVDAGSGNEIARYEYGPFGDLTQASGLMARANPIRFSSKYHDDATGLIYCGYRYYSPTFQRWLNRDPLGEEGGLNLYGFVNNDPINGYDSLGLYTSLNALAGASAADIAFLLGEGAAGGMAIGMLMEEARQFGKWAGGDCNALNPDRIIDQGASGALWGAALAVPSAYAVRAVGVAFNAIRASLSAAPSTAAMQTANAVARQVAASRLTQAEFDFVKGDLSGRLTQWSVASLGSRVAAQYQQFYNEAWQQTIQAHVAGRIEISAGQNLMTVLGQRTDAAARTALTRWVNAQGLAKDVLINKRFYDPSGSGAYRIPDVRIPSEKLILDGTIGTKTLGTPQVQDFMNWSGGRIPFIINPTITPVP